MTRKGQLNLRRKYSNLCRATAFGRQNEYSFTQIHFARNRLHCLRVQPTAVGENDEWIARKWVFRKDIDSRVTEYRHALQITLNTAPIPIRKTEICLLNVTPCRVQSSNC